MDDEHFRASFYLYRLSLQGIPQLLQISEQRNTQLSFMFDGLVANEQIEGVIEAELNMTIMIRNVSSQHQSALDGCIRVTHVIFKDQITSLPRF